MMFCAALCTFCACVPKLRLVGDTVISVDELVPVPVSGTLCGLPAAPSVTVTLAERAPPTVGVNVTLIAQDVFAASVAGQLFVCAKSLVFDPVTAMPLIDSGAFPLFATV